MPKHSIQPGKPVSLPGYWYDARTHNYATKLPNGRVTFVSRTDITNLLRDVTAGSEARLAEFGRMMATDPPQMTARQFYEAMQREVKTMTNANAALAKGGWAQMTPSDWGRNGAQLREEYGRLRAFAAEIEAGNLTPAQIEARAQLYANTTYARYWQIRTEQEVAAGVMQERLVTMGDDRVCEICQGEASRSWVPVGTYNPPIHAGCRCDVDYQSGATKGGAGSGNFGHRGRPGQIGGSAPGGGMLTSEFAEFHAGDGDESSLPLHLDKHIRSLSGIKDGERSMIVDRQGNVLAQAESDRDTVKAPIPDGAKDVIVLHSHPANWSLSYQDVIKANRYAREGKSNELWAISRDLEGRTVGYRVKVTKPWTAQEWGESFMPKIDRYERKMAKKWNSLTGDTLQSGGTVMHATWKWAMTQGPLKGRATYTTFVTKD